MGIKRIVDVNFWTDEKVVDLFSPEDKLFFLYLLTNPHTTQLGIYQVSKKMMAFEIGYSTEAVSVLLDRFEKKYGVINYSPETNEVAIKNYLRHSIIKGGKPVEDLLMKEVSKVKNRDLLKYVCMNLSASANLNETVSKILSSINDNDNDNDVSYHDSYHDSSKPKKEIISPPTLEEISAYIISKNYIIDAKDFFDYYESNDWKTKEGKSIKKNWKQYVVTWNNREKKSQSERQPQKRLPDFPSPYKSVLEEIKPITIEEQEIKGRYVVDEDYVLPEPPTIMDFGIYCRDHNLLGVNPPKIHATYVSNGQWKEGIKYFDMETACKRAYRGINGIPEEFYQLPKKWEDEE